MAKAEIAYDAGIVNDFAARLYKQAKFIIFTSTFIGLLVGAIVAAGGAMSVHMGSSGIVLIIGTVIGGVLGFSRGQERAFKLKLEAQIALCQVQIEKNTSVK